VDIPQPPFLPSIYDWFENSLTQSTKTSFITLTDVRNRTYNSNDSTIEEQCTNLTPRTALFKRIFNALKSGASSVQIVEALYHSGFTTQILDTLPESVLVPFREALTDCQSRPQISWGRKLLSLVGREDVNMLLFSEQKERVAHASLLVLMTGVYARVSLTFCRHRHTRLIMMSTPYVRCSQSMKQ